MPTRLIAENAGKDGTVVVAHIGKKNDPNWGYNADTDKYEVFAVRFATLANFPVASLVAGADRSRRMDIAMMIWVLKGVDGRVAVVDSGFQGDQSSRQVTVKDYVKPSDAIAPLGLKPGDRIATLTLGLDAQDPASAAHRPHRVDRILDQDEDRLLQLGLVADQQRQLGGQLGRRRDPGVLQLAAQDAGAARSAG